MAELADARGLKPLEQIMFVRVRVSPAALNTHFSFETCRFNTSLILSNQKYMLDLVINKSSIRSRNIKKFRKCIELRKQGLSYSEIRELVPVAKSTLQNWLAFAGLTLTKEHLEIQLRKAVEKRAVATEASRLTRSRKKEEEIQKFILQHKKFLDNPFFICGITLYEAEGSKDKVRFSNSDYRMLQVFINFLEKYFSLERDKNMKFRLYVHTTREEDLGKIKGFWSNKLAISFDDIPVSWKKNKVAYRRENPDYVGQMSVTVYGIPLFSRKLLAISDIILRKYCRVV